jgi:hypothetical protein
MTSPGPAGRIERALRIRAAAAAGIRIVPKDPDPREFPPVRFACDERPKWCLECCKTRSGECPYEVGTKGVA